MRKEDTPVDNKAISYTIADAPQISGRLPRAGLFVTDHTGKLTFLHQELLSIMQMKESELIGQNWDYILLDEDRRSLDTYLKDWMAKKEVFSFHSRVKCAEGQTRWTRLTMTPLPVNTEISPGIIGFLEDITAFLKKEEDHYLYKWLVDNIGDFIGLYTLEGKPIYMNAAALQILGMQSMDDALTFRAGDIFAPESQEHFQKEILPELKNTGWWNGQSKLRTLTEGESADVTMSVFLLHSAGIGDPICMAIICRDITQSIKQLDRQSFEDRLVTVGRLAGGVAQDFNNLLTAILGYAELTERSLGPGQEAVEYIRKIEKAAIRAADLTHQLLAFAGKQILVPSRLNLNNLIFRLLEMIRREVGTSISVLTLPDINLWDVHADEKQMEEVLMRLTANAHQSMPSGGNFVLETRNVTLDKLYTNSHKDVIPGDYVLITMSDSGAGLNDEERLHLFDPFYFASSGTSTAGLGLCSCYGIVRQHRGYIHVYSEISQGTIFKIYLPRYLGTRTPHASDTIPSTPQGTETILFVDDDPSVRSMCLPILQQHGYTILEAEDGNSAEKICREHPGEIHLLVTDVIMPGLAGRELANKVRSIHPEVKVLFTSGYTQHTIIHQGILSDGGLFLSKPFSRSSLVWMVRAALENPIDEH
jgi:PAS domain S-box-containing protein